MQAIIVVRDSYGKPRVWASFRQKADFNVIERMHDAVADEDGTVHPLVYQDALMELALYQIEPYETAEDLIKDLKIFYKGVKKKYGL